MPNSNKDTQSRGRVQITTCMLCSQYGTLPGCPGQQCCRTQQQLQQCQASSGEAKAQVQLLRWSCTMQEHL